jgi:hypothetical protein
MTHLVIFLVVALALGALGLITFIVMMTRNASRQREEQLDRAMRQHGLVSLEKEAFPDRLDWLDGVGKLNGGPRNVKRAWRGDYKNRPVECVHHRYVISTGQTTSTVQHRVVATPIPEAWPYLQLGEENIFTRIGSALGGEDIQVEDEQFNKRWRIRTEDEAFAVVLLVPPLQQLLRDAPRGQQWFITNGRLILLEKGDFKAEETERLLSLLMDFRERIPEELDSWEPSDASKFDVSDVLKADDDER